MATIGDVVVNLEVNRNGFANGIDDASSKMSKFGSMAKSGIGAGAKIATAGVAAIGAATVAAAAVIVPNVARSMESIGRLAKESDKLNIASENLSGLQYAAQSMGAEAEDVGEFMKNMNEKVGLARFGDAGAIEQFEKLGIGMKDLEGLSTMETFNLMADSLMAMDDPTQRLAASLELFGEEGNKMLGLMSQGSGAIGELVSEAERMGVAVNRLDAAKVEAANAAYAKLQAGITGLWNTLTVQLAPILEHVTNQFMGWMGSGTNASDMITNGLRMVVQGIGIVGDVVNGVIGVFEFAQAGATKSLAWILSAVNKLAEGLSYLGGLVGMDFDTSFLADMAAEMHRMADQDVQAAANKIDSAMRGEFGADLINQFDDIQAKANETAQGIADAAADNINNPIADALDDSLAKTKELEQAAKQIFDATRNPMEQFEAEATKLQELFSKGLLDEETFGRAMEKLKEDTQGKFGVDDVGDKADLTNNKAIQKGSAEAMKFVVNAAMGGRSSAEEKTLREQQQQTKVNQEMLAVLRDIKTNKGAVQLVAANL